MTIYMNNPELGFRVQRRGCWLLAILYIMEKRGVLEVTPQLVNSLHEPLRASDRHVISRKTIVIRPQEFLDYLAPGRFKWLRKVEEILPTDEVVMVHTDTGGGKHSVVQKPGDRIEYNPMGRVSSLSATAPILGYRIIRDLKVG